jgi:integrase
MGGCSRVPAAVRSAKAFMAVWHQARAAAMPQDGTGAQPVRRPYDLRHAALSLWLASGAPPAEVAARAGHSVRVLLTTYAHGIPGCDQIASQHIEQALNPSHWPLAGPQQSHADAGNPVRHASAPQLDPAGHSWT